MISFVYRNRKTYDKYQKQQAHVFMRFYVFTAPPRMFHCAKIVKTFR